MTYEVRGDSDNQGPWTMPSQDPTFAEYREAATLLRRGTAQQRLEAQRLEDEENRQRDLAVDGMERFWRNNQALRPSNILAHRRHIIRYHELLDGAEDVGAGLGHSLGLLPEEAAARLAAASVRDELSDRHGNTKPMVAGRNRRLETNLAQASLYLKENLSLLSLPDGILGANEASLKLYGLEPPVPKEPNRIVQFRLTSRAPMLARHSGIVTVLVADVVHSEKALPMRGGERLKVLEEAVKAMARFYGLGPKTNLTDPILHVLAECLVVEAHDFANESEYIKRRLAERIVAAAHRSRIFSAKALPQRAADIFSMCINYDRQHPAFVLPGVAALGSVVRKGGVWLGLVEDE